MKKFLIYMILISLSFLSCKEILFNASESTRTISLDDFHAVKIYGDYNIFLVQDSANRLDITGSNKINLIDAVVRNDTLTINNHQGISFNPNKNRIFLHFTDMKYLVTYDPVNISGSGIIKANQFIYEALGEIVEARLEFDCDNLYFVNSGNTLGFFYFKGKANSCLLWNRYGGTIFADSLFCKDAEVINSSAGDVYVNVSEMIRASIRGPGNIYYHGNPSIELVEKKGTGRLIPVN
jgi:hypothetical protein